MRKLPRLLAFSFLLAASAAFGGAEHGGMKHGMAPAEPMAQTGAEPILALVDYTDHSGSGNPSDGVAVIDLNPASADFGKIVQKFPMGPETVPHHIYYDREGGRIYNTALGKGSALYRIELKGDRIADISPVNVEPCRGGENLYFTEDRDKIYLTCIVTSQVVVLDADNANKLAVVETPQTFYPRIVNPHGFWAKEWIDRAILTNTITPGLDNPRSSVTVLELSTGRAISTHPLAKDATKPSAPVEVLFLPERPVAYITAMLEGTIWEARWNPGSEAFDFEIVYDGSGYGDSWPLEMYIGPEGYLYVSFAHPGIVNVYDIKGGSPVYVKMLPAGHGAHHIAFSRDGRYMFVQNNLLNIDGLNDGTISVVDLKTDRLVAQVDSFIKEGLQPESILLVGGGYGGH